MNYTMAELLAMHDGGLLGWLQKALSEEPDGTTRKQAIIAALAVLLGEPKKATPLADMMAKAARKARQDG